MSDLKTKVLSILHKLRAFRDPSTPIGTTLAQKVRSMSIQSMDLLKSAGPNIHHEKGYAFHWYRLMMATLSWFLTWGYIELVYVTPVLASFAGIPFMALIMWTQREACTNFKCFDYPYASYLKYMIQMMGVVMLSMAMSKLRDVSVMTLPAPLWYPYQKDTSMVGLSLMCIMSVQTFYTWIGTDTNAIHRVPMIATLGICMLPLAPFYHPFQTISFFILILIFQYHAWHYTAPHPYDALDPVAHWAWKIKKDPAAIDLFLNTHDHYFKEQWTPKIIETLNKHNPLVQWAWDTQQWLGVKSVLNQKPLAEKSIDLPIDYDMTP